MLKPIRGDLYLDYRCVCGTVHQISYKEVNVVGKILCFCGKLLKLAPFKAELKMNYRMKKPKVNPVSRGQSSKISYNKPNRDEVIYGMVALGYKKAEAKRIVDSYDDGQMSNDTLLQACIKKK